MTLKLPGYVPLSGYFGRPELEYYVERLPAISCLGKGLKALLRITMGFP